MQAVDDTPGPEVLTWRSAATDKPDSDTTVLCWGSEGFFCGWWDDSIPGWLACESGGSVLGVTHWSEPNGPAAIFKAADSVNAAQALEVANVSILRLDPGDRLVISTSKMMTKEQRESLFQRAKAFSGTDRLLILDGGLSMSVLKAPNAGDDQA